MNSDHDIEVTEETSAAAEALESASGTALDHAAAASGAGAPPACAIVGRSRTSARLF